MKFLRGLFLINSLIVLTFFVLLFTSESETRLAAEFTTDIPKPAAFKLLLKNLTDSGERLDGAAPATVKLTFFANGKLLNLPFRLQKDESNYRLFLLPQLPADRLFAIKELSHQIILKTLVDGSTNVQWQLHYRVNGWTARLLNRFFWKRALSQFVEKRINELKRPFAS